VAEIDDRDSADVDAWRGGRGTGSIYHARARARRFVPRRLPFPTRRDGRDSNSKVMAPPLSTPCLPGLPWQLWLLLRRNQCAAIHLPLL
jgi:hypothetical protein